MPTDHEKRLHKQRDLIDAIDADILSLMNQRLDAAKVIADIKSELSEPAYYRPEREAQVLKRLRSLNQGNLENQSLETLFREIMSITRGSEAGLSVAVLGPSGTYTEQAARSHFGQSVKVEPCSTINEIFRVTEIGRADFAVVPVENSTEGGISSTLDRLVNTSLKVCGEINMEIHHNLLASVESMDQIKRVLAHPQSLGQCRRWLERNRPDVEQIPVASNAEAAVQVVDSTDSAAIAGQGAALQYKLNTLFANIEDEPGNTTRFLVLSQRKTPASGDDKTSLVLATRNKPGALFDLLKPLADHDISMSKIESRPSRTGLWEYLFFIDILGHEDDAAVALAIDALRREAGFYKKLGAYPAAS